jgi:hypothetical protein
VYNYHGRSSVGVNDLKLQNAIVEVHGRVIVQSINERTLHVKVGHLRIKKKVLKMKLMFMFSSTDGASIGTAIG